MLSYVPRYLDRYRCPRGLGRAGSSNGLAGRGLQALHSVLYGSVHDVPTHIVKVAPVASSKLRILGIPQLTTRAD